MKKGGLVLLIFHFLFGYGLAVKSSKDYKILKSMGIKCDIKNNMYLCAESDDKNRLLKIQRYLKENLGIDSVILNEIHQNENIKNGYCIQVSSSKSEKDLEKLFNELKIYPFSRVEKIGSFYVLRVGESSKKSELNKILNKIKKLKKDAFVRKCDLIPKRIIKGGFTKKSDTTINDVLKKIEKIVSNKSKLKKNVPDVKERNGSILSKKQERVEFKQNPFKQTIFSLYEKGKYKRVCDMLTKLTSFYGSDFQKIKIDACYKYYYTKGMEYLYVQPDNALVFFDKAGRFKNSKEVLFASAIAYIQKRDYKKAVELLKKLYEKNPYDSAIKLAYAKALFDLGDFEELNKISDSSLVFFEHYNMFKKAKEYYERGNYAEAEKIIEKLRVFYPNNTRILLLNGNIEYKLGNYDLAYVFYKKVLSVESANVKALKGIQKLALINTDIRSAAEIADILKKLNYKNGKLNDIMKEYYLLKADKFRKGKKYTDALEMVKKAMKYSKYDKDIEFMYGKIYEDMGNYDKALEYFRMLNAKNPTTEVKKELVKLYIEKGDFETAKEISNNTTNEIKAMYYTALAEYYYKKHNFTKANKYISIALSFYPLNTNEIYILKAKICEGLENLQCAKTFYEKAKLETPEDKLEYALVLAKLGLKNKAFHVAQNVKSDSKNVLLKKATIMIQLGKTKEAKKIFEMVD